MRSVLPEGSERPTPTSTGRRLPGRRGGKRCAAVASRHPRRPRTSEAPRPADRGRRRAARRPRAIATGTIETMVPLRIAEASAPDRVIAHLDLLVSRFVRSDSNFACVRRCSAIPSGGIVAIPPDGIASDESPPRGTPRVSWLTPKKAERRRTLPRVSWLTPKKTDGTRRLPGVSWLTPKKTDRRARARESAG